MFLVALHLTAPFPVRGTRVSVFDMLEAYGCKNLRLVWKRLQKRYTEVLTKCFNFALPGGAIPRRGVDTAYPGVAKLCEVFA